MILGNEKHLLVDKEVYELFKKGTLDYINMCERLFERPGNLEVKDLRIELME